jgi:hypothetical protein
VAFQSTQLLRIVGYLSTRGEPRRSIGALPIGVKGIGEHGGGTIGVCTSASAKPPKAKAERRSRRAADGVVSVLERLVADWAGGLDDRR